MPRFILQSDGMTSIGIVGAAGRMGRSLLRAVAENPALALGCAIETPHSAYIGEPATALVAEADAACVISADKSAISACAAVIEFSSPTSTLETLALCVQHRVPMVIGTTGFDAVQLAQVEQAALRLPVLMADNFSVGVNVMLGLITQASKALSEDFDIEVLEMHHNKKVDAPSGTALAMGRAAAAASGRSLETHGVFAREGITGARVDKTIGFATLRGSDVVGEHTMFFAGMGERVEISHRATDRMIYARGAVRAANWLGAQAPGRYDMQDVLGFGGF